MVDQVQRKDIPQQVYHQDKLEEVDKKDLIVFVSVATVRTSPPVTNGNQAEVVDTARKIEFGSTGIVNRVSPLMYCSVGLKHVHGATQTILPHPIVYFPAHIWALI